MGDKCQYKQHKLDKLKRASAVLHILPLYEKLVPRTLILKD